MPFKKKPELYCVWSSMRDRCSNPNNPQWADYGGRGITVCDRWQIYRLFEADMLPRPTGTSIDRINNDGNYEPGNCRWADRKTQQRNQRRSVILTIEGSEYRLAELHDACAKKSDTIRERAERGLSLADVLFSGNHDVSKAKIAVRRPTCKHGHEFTPENSYFCRHGWRHCRACHNAKMRRRNAVAKERMTSKFPDLL